MMSSFGIVESSSSVEALAFNYFRYGLFVLVNNLWTLVAVVTAAVSFWRFSLLPSLLARRHFLLKSSSASPVAAAAPDADSQPQPMIISRLVDSETSAAITPPLLPVAESYAVAVKGNRLYSHFCYDDVTVDDDEEEEEEERRVLEVEDDQTLRFDALERLRLSDLGFYHYQDMRVLDGNVVKLWDDNTLCRPPRSGRHREGRQTTNVVRLRKTSKRGRIGINHETSLTKLMM